jgi:glucose/arabinose dehydrogenase
VAFHGSWNRSVATGYKVVRYNLDQNRNAVGAPIDFVTGFLPEGGDPNEAIGRPVGILAEDDAIYISDDRAGAVYRIAPTQ